MSASPNDFVPESGTRPSRIEFVREDTRGVTPADPDWSTYSDHVVNFWDWEPEANKATEQPAGSMDPDITPPGPESHEATISYWLQNWLVDSNGDPLDAAADAMLLSQDNDFLNTHSAVSRMEVFSNGADGAGYRIYHVGKGGAPTEVTLPFETEDGTPVVPELSYQFEKMRVYRIDQPSASTTLDVTNNGTTSVDVTLESEGAATSETVTVAGGTTSTTTASFGDIDAVELDTDTDGTVVVSDGAGTNFLTIHGSDEYTHGGDLGVPALGAGSHAAEIGTDYVSFNDSDYGYATGDIAAEIISGELNVSLETDDNGVMGTSRRNIHPSGRRATWSATVAGASESVDQVTAYLTQMVNDVEWAATEGTITGPNAEHMSAGSSDFETGTGKNERELELLSQGINITAN